MFYPMTRNIYTFTAYLIASIAIADILPTSSITNTATLIVTFCTIPAIGALNTTIAVIT